MITVIHVNFSNGAQYTVPDLNIEGAFTIDTIRAAVREIYPDLDTSGLMMTSSGSVVTLHPKVEYGA